MSDLHHGGGFYSWQRFAFISSAMALRLSQSDFSFGGSQVLGGKDGINLQSSRSGIRFSKSKV